MTPATEERRQPFWTYHDLVLFMTAVLPSLALAALLLRGSRLVAPQFFKNEAATALAFQVFMYAFLLGALFLVVSWKYGRPFWKSLNWTLRFPGAVVIVAAGPVLAVGLSLLGVALRAPMVNNPIERMITGRISLAIVTAFGVFLAPFFEEIFFRGFLYPLFARTLGPWGGVALTAVPFALLHGAQNEWAWQQVTLIAVAGIAFGIARVKTGSTAGAFLLHATYNATQFAGLILTKL
jgi:membrane protease YdiL (CAAX protease family)